MHTIIRDNYDPTPNEYHETIVVDEAREKRWLFDCDGVFQDITNVKVVSERGESEDYAASQKWVTEELEALEDADQALQDNLDAEETARIAADETLQDNIDAEEADRTAADIEIWDEIETLEAASDVVDVVGTKAELDEYDTSTLTDEDIIKVLQDETKEDATTYYRWDKTNSTFVYVGEEGPYYTQTQVDTLLDGKQDKLIAGANIQIAADGKTISATDTTYSDFAGTDGTAAGAAGLVPAPATTDAGKYLKADGTWTAISIPTVTLYSGTGQNTDGAMTQKAVTDTLFENNDTTRIKIGSGAVNSGAASIVIGSQGAQVLTPNSVAIGNGGTTAGSSGGAGYNVAIGSYGVVATGGQSVAIGGYGATATAEGTIAIGTNEAQASGVGSIAIGRFVRASHKDSVALGTDAITGRASEVSIGQDAAWPNPEVTKYIAHVTAGVNDTDAVNVAQLNAAIPGAMTGATSSAAGTSGLVPAPAAGDDTKFLSGDGTWKTVTSGGPYTAGNGINIANDEISVDTTVVATQTDLAGKQDTLTAGTNITITNNTISAVTNNINSTDWNALWQ